MAGGWRRLHNEELHDVYASPNIRTINSTRTRWARQVACIREMKNDYKILVGRPEPRWEDNIRMDLREIGWEDVDWMHMDQNRDQWRALANMMMNLRVL
jgi:hypothetical protein